MDIKSILFFSILFCIGDIAKQLCVTIFYWALIVKGYVYLRVYWECSKSIQLHYTHKMVSFCKNIFIIPGVHYMNGTLLLFLCCSVSWTFYIVIEWSALSMMLLLSVWCDFNFYWWIWMELGEFLGGDLCWWALWLMCIGTRVTQRINMNFLWIIYISRINFLFAKESYIWFDWCQNEAS